MRLYAAIRASISVSVVLSMGVPSWVPRSIMVWMMPEPLNCRRPSTTFSTVNSGELGRSIRRIVSSTAESSLRILLSAFFRASATSGLNIIVELVSTDTLASG